jgi:hypothetical protein
LRLKVPMFSQALLRTTSPPPSAASPSHASTAPCRSGSRHRRFGWIAGINALFGNSENAERLIRCPAPPPCARGRAVVAGQRINRVERNRVAPRRAYISIWGLYRVRHHAGYTRTTLRAADCVAAQRISASQGTDAPLEPDRPDSLVVRDALVLLRRDQLLAGLSSSQVAYHNSDPPRSGLVQRPLSC